MTDVLWAATLAGVLIGWALSAFFVVFLSIMLTAYFWRWRRFKQENTRDDIIRAAESRTQQHWLEIGEAWRALYIFLAILVTIYLPFIAGAGWTSANLEDQLAAEISRLQLLKVNESLETNTAMLELKENLVSVADSRFWLLVSLGTLHVLGNVLFCVKIFIVRKNSNFRLGIIRCFFWQLRKVGSLVTVVTVTIGIMAVQLAACALWSLGWHAESIEKKLVGERLRTLSLMVNESLKADMAVLELEKELVDTKPSWELHMVLAKAAMLATFVLQIFVWLLAPVSQSTAFVLAVWAKGFGYVWALLVVLRMLVADKMSPMGLEEELAAAKLQSYSLMVNESWFAGLELELKEELVSTRSWTLNVTAVVAISVAGLMGVVTWSLLRAGKLRLPRTLQWELNACKDGDLEYVSWCISEDRYNKDWKIMMETAYDNKHMDVVRCIRDSERLLVDVTQQLQLACQFGDLEFVSGWIAENRDEGQNVNWERLIQTAYDNKHMDVVRCMRDNGRGSVDIQLYGSCLLGDLEFVSQCIAEDRDRRQNVNWERLMQTAYDNKHMDVLSCIRDSGRVSERTRLNYPCLLGDLEFVSQCIAEDRDRGQNVDWLWLMDTAYAHNVDIAQAIVGSGKYTLADMKYNSDKTRIMFAIEHTVDVNKEICPGLNTLHVAAYMCVSQWYTHQNTYTDSINLVLNKGANVNRKGYMGRTALHFLCHGQNTDVDNIIERRIKPNEANQQQTKKSKLHVGGEIRAENMVNIINNVIENGGDVNSTDDSGQTPLHLLCLSEGDVTIGTVLIERGADINKRDNEGRTPLAVAAQHGNEKFVSFLCGKGCDKNMGTFLGETPLYLSAVANNIRSAEILCENGVDVNQANDYNITPLAAACECDNNLIVDMLLQYGSDLDIPDMEEKTALHKTVEHGSIESFNIMMGKNVDLNVQDITGFTPLHLATIEHNLQIIKVLLAKGCNIHVANNLGNIALHNAVSTYNEKNESKDNKQIIEILLQKGTKIDHRNNFGHTPIMVSANALNLTMMKFLYDNKANLRLVNNMQRGLFHIVVASYSENYPQQPIQYQKCQGIIEWLIEKGLCINAYDVNKQTPLHLAAQQGVLELVTFLVNNGSDVTSRDSFNHMPLMNALDHPEVFRYLWEKTLPDITDDDFCKLQRLCYWLDISEEMKSQIIEYAPNVIELRNMPQSVRRLTLRYSDSLEKWLRTEKKELPEFMESWLPSLQPLTYFDHPTINKVMWEFLNDLQEGVKKEDPFVAYHITRCGSVEEKTKVFAQDENDCSCVLQNIRFEMFDAPTQTDHHVWTAFVHLICKEKYFDHLKRVLDGKQRLSQGKLCHYFGKAIGKVLTNPAFWDKYPQLQRISAKDISAGDRRICTMHVIWSDEICPWLKIDIDLAPVIDLSKWKPSWCSKHPLLDEIECIALPKWKMTHNVNMDLMEIGVHSWGPLFHKMPEEMRQGYRLSKVVRGSAVCPQILQFPGQAFVPEAQSLNVPEKALMSNELEEWSNAGEFMNTYLLKQVIMHEYTAWYDQKMKGLEPPVHTNVYWARQIYEKMEEAFKCRELYSWFIPTYNLLTDEKFVQFQDTAIMYARLCRRLLTEEAEDHFRKAYLGGPQGCQGNP